MHAKEQALWWGQGEEWSFVLPRTGEEGGIRWAEQRGLACPPASLCTHLGPDLAPDSQLNPAFATSLSIPFLPAHGHSLLKKIVHNG